MSEFDKRFSDSTNVLAASAAFRKGNSFMEPEVLQPLTDHYASFIDRELIAKQLPLAKRHLNNVQSDGSLLQLIEELKKLPVAYSEVLKLLQIFATLPVTTASNERFFSVLKRVKNYLRTRMTDQRLEALMFLAGEQEVLLEISLDDAVNDFGIMKRRRYPVIH